MGLKNNSKTFRERELEHIRQANERWLLKDPQKTSKSGANSTNRPWGNSDRRFIRDIDRIKKI